MGAQSRYNILGLLAIKGLDLPRFLPHMVPYSASVDLESSLPLSQSWGCRLPSEHRLKKPDHRNPIASQMTHSALKNILCLEHCAALRLCLCQCFSLVQQCSSEVNPSQIPIHHALLSITKWFLHTWMGSHLEETTRDAPVQVNAKCAPTSCGTWSPNQCLALQTSLNHMWCEDTQSNLNLLQSKITDSDRVEM